MFLDYEMDATGRNRCLSVVSPADTADITLPMQLFSWSFPQVPVESLKKKQVFQRIEFNYGLLLFLSAYHTGIMSFF